MSHSISVAQKKPSGLLINLVANTDRPNTFISSENPLFSWIVPGNKKGTRQTAYRILVSDSYEKALKGEGNIWDSNKLTSDSSTSVSAKGLYLKPSKSYFWSVKIWSNTGGESVWSDIKTFYTSDKLERNANASEALVKTRQLPIIHKKISPSLTFLDFGKDAFAQLSVTLTSKSGKDTVFVSFGEAVTQGITNGITQSRLDANPGGTIRYQKVVLPLTKGSRTYQIKLKKDQRNTGSAAILMPPYIGEVFPFRYVEIEGYTGKISKSDVQRDMVHYPFDEQASHFKSSNDTLNKIWELCKYSIKATSFAGIYVDGDRERIPYEADALINQLGHYGVDREYSMARNSTAYLLKHPTWPTEWILQALIISWNDYLYTGDKQLLQKNYTVLKNRTLTQLKGPKGLISTTTGLQTPVFAQSINFNGKIKDIVDWPVSETDGYVFNNYNTVVNAFYYKALKNMALIAQVLDQKADEQLYQQEANATYNAFNERFLDDNTGLYKDGDVTKHSSLHANMFALTLGLVPDKHRSTVMKFIKSKGMASSVYGSQFLMESLYDGFESDYARKLLTDSSIRSWYNMLRVGSTITLEAWDNTFKPNQDWNHAWGAAPANIIPRKLMGIEPAKAGFEEVTIKPQTADLQEAEILMPTIRGPISLKITNKKSYTLKVRLPANMSGRLFLPQIAGKTKIFLNGKSIDPKQVPGEPFLDAGVIESGLSTFTMEQK